MKLDEILNELTLPPAKGVVVLLSGGLDSTTSLHLATKHYGKEKVKALSFFYGQKQKHELEMAKKTCESLGVEHKVIDISFLGVINEGFSANTTKAMAMPGIKEVLGDPQPKTYVANRNMILMSIAAAFAETKGFDVILCGLQSNDLYNYHDTTEQWLDKLNSLLAENRKICISVIAPFVALNKRDEILAIKEMYGNVDVFKNTLTCYAPDENGKSCGVCPSCSERLAAFKELNLTDPVEYF